LCDLRPKQAESAKKLLDGTSHNPKLYSGREDAWKDMIDTEDLDLIYIATPWALHVPMAIYAMNAGRHVAVEVPAAKTIDECWELRSEEHTSELQSRENL